MKRRFTYIGGGSNKFWEIEEPKIAGNSWAVTVCFGRIGTWGQDHTNVFSSELAAHNHYHRKVAEKKAKGYKETGKVEVKKNVVNYTPDYIPPSLKATPCAHDNLTRNGNTWKCSKCGSKVEFDKQTAVEETIEVVAKVRRFFNLSARAE